jgi:hypothetical protein
MSVTWNWLTERSLELQTRSHERAARLMLWLDL